MSFDAFCYFPSSNVKGETQDEDMSDSKYNAFEILEFSIETKNNINIGSISGGGGAGKAEFEPMTIKKKTDTASTALFANLCEGKHFEDMVIVLRRSGGATGKSGTTFLKWEFKLVMIESLSWSGSDGDDICEEELKIEYGAIKVTYYKQEGDGKMKEHSQTMWSRVKNKGDFVVK